MDRLLGPLPAAKPYSGEPTHEAHLWRAPSEQAAATGIEKEPCQVEPTCTAHELAEEAEWALLGFLGIPLALAEEPKETEHF